MHTSTGGNSQPPRRRAKTAGYRLSNGDAAIAKALLVLGWRQCDVAAVFRVNQGRIAEISIGKRFTEIAPADPAAIPKELLKPH